MTTFSDFRLTGAERYRIGRTLGRTLYAQLGDTASSNDVFLGLFNTRNLAQLAADALNGHPPPATRWFALGRLIYLQAGPLMLDDFLATMDTPAVAAAVVNTVNRG